MTKAPPRVVRGWQLAVAVVCLTGGLLFGTAHSYSGGRDIRPRNQELANLITDAQADVSQAEAAAQALQASISGAAGLDVSPQVEQAQASAAAAQDAAGLTPLTGPGLRVTLTDAPRDSDGNYPEGVNPDDLVIHQQDVQAVVNALWAGGAEAMMIMDQRVITTSAVRCVGNTLLLQGRVYSPPFVIAAIGPADTMQSAIQAQPGVILLLQYVAAFNLGFQVEQVDSIDIPGYDGLVRMTAATEPTG